MKSRLKKFYQDQIVSEIIASMKYGNINDVARLTKICVNQGVNSTMSRRLASTAAKEVDKIVSQKSVPCISKKAIAGFKIRAGEVVGRKVTIRRNRIFSFLDRITNLAFPRIRDFNGLQETNFDTFCNFTLGLEEKVMFPEINYDEIECKSGIDICFVSSARSLRERKKLLGILGIPFQNQ